MPIQNISMKFYKNTRPIDNQVQPPTGFNKRAPTAKYYRKTSNCCNTLINDVFKNVCCRPIIRSANTYIPVDPNTGKTVDYSQSRVEYLNSRCKTFQQNSFNFDYNIITKEARSNCCNTEKCNIVTYKPNNTKYSTQGAVSSSARLLRLKYNNITTSAKYNQNHIRYRGDLTQNIFINKSGLCNKC
jgi:hypothetical protein